NKTDLVGPLASFQATAFNKAEVRQLLITINNAGKDAGLKEGNLDATFDKWWPDLEEKVDAILSAEQPPEEPHRSERDLLEEAVTNTRTLLREFQALPLPWQSFMMPEIRTAAEELRSQQRSSGLGGILGGLTAKSE